jgi:hypothetical protein
LWFITQNLMDLLQVGTKEALLKIAFF